MSTATDTAEAGEKKKGGKKLLFIIIGAAAVVLIAAGAVVFMMLQPKGGAAEPDPAKENGAVVALDKDMTLNLSDGKFLKTQLALQLSKKATEEAGGEAAIEKGFDTSKARDAAISVLSKYSYQQLLQPKVREQAQNALSEETSKRYEGGVLKVYFTEFVMQ